jgi:hypothetical protein
MFLKSDPIADGCNVLTLTVSSLEFLSEEWHDYGTSQFKLMQRYRITIPLVAIRLCTSSDSEKPGMLVSLPEDAMVEVGGRSPVGNPSDTLCSN